MKNVKVVVELNIPPDNSDPTDWVRDSVLENLAVDEELVGVYLLEGSSGYECLP